MSTNVKSSEGKVVYRYKTDFKDLCVFLSVSNKEFEEMRKNRSIVEIAKDKGIKEEVLHYFLEKKFNSLAAAYDKGDIDLNFIMDYVLYLKEDTIKEIHAKKPEDL
ncbi:hypothetical protein [Priestia endophytica]|uniref:hypothetical protein n=1 Tax=Priestia endophytica TaxID=135735 RepID=UPI00227E59FC|nr:hypothetical protein [Priestia endophytica]MCY8234773.1 hypothetical protein [Priestia endophytica]